MKIDFNKNNRQLDSVRSQIKKSEDLEKFDSFISKYDVFDTDNQEHMAEARKCCSGENCCSIVIQVPEIKFGL